MDPKTLLLRPQLRKRFSLLAGLSSALVSIIDPVSVVSPAVLRGMKQTAHKPVTFIDITKGPATEPGDRYNVLLILIKALAIFSQGPLNNIFILDMFITGRTYGRATGKTAFFLIRETESDGGCLHILTVPYPQGTRR